MAATLLLQLLLSFVIGGSLIALLTILAEKAGERTAGIILMLPTTIVIGFFFLGCTTSARNVAHIVPATLIPLGIVVFSSVIYIYYSLFISKYIRSKKTQILITFIATSITWFFLAAPFAIYRFSSIITGIAGYIILAFSAHYMLNKRGNKTNISRLSYTLPQIIFRAAFIGAMIAIVVYLGKILDPFWGGVFTMYPAATLATLIILHYYYEPLQLFYFMKKAPTGSISIFIYAICAMVLFPSYGIITGTFLSYSASLFFSVAYVGYLRKR